MCYKAENGTCAIIGHLLLEVPIRLSGFSNGLFPYSQKNDFGKAVPSNSAYDESVTCVRFDRISY
jgi:hypothetical protein